MKRVVIRVKMAMLQRVGSASTQGFRWVVLRTRGIKWTVVNEIQQKTGIKGIFMFRSNCYYESYILKQKRVLTLEWYAVKCEKNVPIAGFGLEDHTFLLRHRNCMGR
ncbi:hypothetical protein HNY73_022940 [Argiope bruennichi]|uniref:Uncharacterized protein n=1 Tax=Argiope bruennichi TaxID=94029 RepID=A0A8T0E3S6_ARGBR|nr:hypothetical protein HNY73_022940 [Argiope bruennichi]